LMVREEANVTRVLLAKKVLLARAVTLVARAFKGGGRLFYFGAGTSGRLGVLDASECPPTFRTDPKLVQGIIAGGDIALRRAVEGAEDDAPAGAREIRVRRITARDVVVGIAASGTTRFVWGALREAKQRRAATMLVCFNPHLVIPRAHRPDVVIAPDLGPEVLTGSTRLKAGTATKIILNILTTLAMVRLGKVASNLMVDVNPSNAKLRTRAVRIVQELTGVESRVAERALQKSGWAIRAACRRLS
jgi:N-acetylmuramic acid 6-phosphate etherase